MNIKIKYTNQITKKIWRKVLKYCQELVILGQFLAFVTLTFKKIILDILSLFLNNVVLCNIFLKAKANYNLNKEIFLLIKYCKNFPFLSKNIESFSDLDLDLEGILG